jgi:formate hydrogenlyase transcriptional activator
MIERAVILSRGNRLELGEWFPKVSKTLSLDVVSLEENERQYILNILERTEWRVSGEKGAAKLLNINPNTLVSRMRKLGIQRTFSN